mgnify:CR=1 FL=1
MGRTVQVPDDGQLVSLRELQAAHVGLRLEAREGQAQQLVHAERAELAALPEQLDQQPRLVQRHQPRR